MGLPSQGNARRTPHAWRQISATSGSASGKSFVAKVLEAEGCPVLSADRVGHEVLVNEASAEVLEAFGTLDRKALAAIVFADPAELRRLNALLYPHIFARQEAWFASLSAPVAVVEAAVMIEAGSHVRYDKIILTMCTEAQQVARALARGGSTEHDVRQRLSRQLPLEEKRKFADYVIDTSGTEAWTREQTIRVYTELLALAA